MDMKGACENDGTVGPSRVYSEPDALQLYLDDLTEHLNSVPRKMVLHPENLFADDIFLIVTPRR